MINPRRRFRANLESLEGKALLSTLPVLTQHTFNQVLKAIDRAAGTFAKTHNEAGFVANLSQISYKVPYGHARLFPTWQTDVGIYDPSVKGSGRAMVKQLKIDLKDYVKESVANGSMAVKGLWIGGSVASTGAGGAIVPVLTMRTYTQAFRKIDRAAGTFAKTHNEAGFVASLSQISYTLPYGHARLFPTWQTDVGIYDPSVKGSGLTMIKQLKADLKDYVHTAVAAGEFRIK